MKRHHEYDLAQAQASTQLWGHDLGLRVRAEIEKLLNEIPTGDVLKVQLKGVEVMDFSFSNEVFGKVISSFGSHYPERAMVLANPSQYVKVNLNAALDSLGLLALTVKGVRSWEALGKVSDTDRETLEVLAKKKQATAPEIAEALNIKLTTCNQRLRKLTDNGVLLRTKVSASTGGDQFVYSWPL